MKKVFVIDESPFKEAYFLLGAIDPATLSERYTEEDQKIMHAKLWDYQNPEIITNKIRMILETGDLSNLSVEENYLRSNILWFWYHHAISSAIWYYSDKEKAKEFSRKALEYQPKGHPNKLTRLFYLLLHDDIAAAEEWQKSIISESEKSSAEWLIAELKTRKFSDCPHFSL